MHTNITLYGPNKYSNIHKKKPCAHERSRKEILSSPHERYFDQFNLTCFVKNIQLYEQLRIILFFGISCLGSRICYCNQHGGRHIARHTNGEEPRILRPLRPPSCSHPVCKQRCHTQSNGTKDSCTPIRQHGCLFLLAFRHGTFQHARKPGGRLIVQLDVKSCERGS